MTTIADLLELPYSGGAAPMVAEDFRAQLHGPMGKRVRWFKAFEVPPGTPGRTKQGLIYIEQEFDAAVRVLIGVVQRDTVALDGTAIPQGTMTVSNDVRALEFARRDRIVVTDIHWTARQLVTRGATATDTLVHPYVTAIAQVLVDGIAVDSDEYEATDSGIQWDTGAGPAAGTVYSIEYRYNPLVEYLAQSENIMQTGGDGVPLPQRGYARLVLPFRSHEP